MICPNCSFDIVGNQTVCPRCQQQLPQETSTPASQVSQQNQVISEDPPSGIVGGGIAAIIFGALAFGGGAGGIVFGIICIAFGIAAIAVTRFGTRWNTLSKGERAVTYLGVVLGAIFIFALKLAANIIQMFTRKS